MKMAACALIVKFTQSMDEIYVVGVSRRDDHDAFGLPGGKCNDGEEPIETARRELFEETGIRAKTLHPIFKRLRVGDDDYDSVTFFVNAYEGEPTTQPGEGVCKWVPASKLLEGPFAEYNRKLFEATGYEDFIK